VVVLTPYQVWQLQYFGCDTCPQSLTNADADSTGQNNLFKYVAGLNPTNPASVFVFTNAGTNLMFSPYVQGRLYTVLYSPALNPANWQPLITSVTNITSSNAVVRDTSGASSQKFYRVEIGGP